MRETFLLLPPFVDATPVPALFAEGLFPKSAWQGVRAACSEAQRVTCLAVLTSSFAPLFFFLVLLFPPFLHFLFLSGSGAKVPQQSTLPGDLISPAAFLVSRGRGECLPWGLAPRAHGVVPYLGLPACLAPSQCAPPVKTSAALRLCVLAARVGPRGWSPPPAPSRGASSITASALTRNHFRRN